MNGSVLLGLRRFPGRQPSLVALHGFTQTGAMFGEIAARMGVEIVAPDLPGHGRSAEAHASFGSAIEGVSEILAEIGHPVPLLGYSQGGRVALGVAIAYPGLVSRLILVSASPGIVSSEERAERRQEDESRAARLASIGVEAFLEEWLASPMFSGLEKRGRAWQERDRARRLENRSSGLVRALRGMGQGNQPYLGHRLGEITIPVLLLAGALDRRYVLLAESMYRLLATGELRIVPDTGHAVIGEEPSGAAELISQFLAED